ncbi:unnamed protein product, partial [Mycena citricolor]
SSTRRNGWILSLMIRVLRREDSQLMEESHEGPL